MSARRSLPARYTVQRNAPVQRVQGACPRRRLQPRRRQGIGPPSGRRCTQSRSPPRHPLFAPQSVRALQSATMAPSGSVCRRMRWPFLGLAHPRLRRPHLRRNNSGANKRPQSEVEQFLAPPGVTLLRPATSRSVRRRRGIPVWKNSTKRAPGPMTARGDRVRCSRDPGSNYRTGSSAPRKTRPRCRRRGRSVVSCGAGRQGPVGNYRETTPPRTRPLVLSTYATLVGNGG